MGKIFLFTAFLVSAAFAPLSSEEGQHLWDINGDKPTLQNLPPQEFLKEKNEDPYIFDSEQTVGEEWDLELPVLEEKEDSPPQQSMSDYFNTHQEPAHIAETPEEGWATPPTEPELVDPPELLPFDDTLDAPPADDLFDLEEEPLPTAPVEQTPEPSTLPVAPEATFSLKRTSAYHPTLPVAEDEPLADFDFDLAENEGDDTLDPFPTGQIKTPPKTILINFNNVSVIEYIRFISRITNKNFTFNEDELQFNVTIISEEPATLDNVMTALIQELQIHGLSLIEQENGLIIHKSPDIRNVPRVHTNGVPTETPRESEMITQVFKLNTLDPTKAAAIAQPLLSSRALIGTSEKTQHIIITDLVDNVEQIVDLFKSLDAPNSGLVIGQYVVRNTTIDNLIELAKQIMEPIAQHQPVTFVPHVSAQSIFIVSSSFLVERTISVLQHLDGAQGTTRIYNMDELRFDRSLQRGEGRAGVPEELPADAPEGRWELTPEGDRVFRPGYLQSPEGLPEGEWLLDAQGNWYFVPADVKDLYPEEGLRRAGIPIEPGEVPEGRWIQDEDGNWVFQLAPAGALQPERLRRRPKIEDDLPVGHIERTQFYLHKLQYRKGEDLVEALQRIGESMQLQGTANIDLMGTIQSSQWLAASNALVFTGTGTSIEKVRELIDEIDRPLRQVFIEMLILDTSLEDSLNYGVAWGTRSGGGNTSTAQAFVGGLAPLTAALLQGTETTGVVSAPNATPLVLGRSGYHMGVIGRRLTHGGAQFATMGAFVEAIHSRGNTNILLNPKIVTEDNKMAEIFVGQNIPYLTQSVTNDDGNIVTGNFEYRDVGTTLRVTPLMGHGNIITLEIEEEVSEVQPGSEQAIGTSGTTSGPTTNLNRTNATIHIPDKCFVILSGLVREVKTIEKNQVPCLGGIPFIGAANKFRENSTQKRNLMIFIRPQIIDTEDQFNKFTRQQQEIMRQKDRMKKSWKFEVDEAMEFMNLRGSCCDECR